MIGRRAFGILLLSALLLPSASACGQMRQRPTRPAPTQSDRAQFPNLRTLETRHYRLHTDIDPAFAQELSQRLDGMYDEYARRLSFVGSAVGSAANAAAAAGVNERFEVYVFTHRSDYVRLVGPQYSNTAGIFISGKNILASFVEEYGKDALRRTLQHEGLHQFVYTAIGPDMPVWLNEGIAGVFEEGIWTGQGFWINQIPPYRLRQIRQDLSGQTLLPFSRFFELSHDQWFKAVQKDPDLAGTYYNQAWAFAQFLINGPSAASANGNRARLTNYILDLKGGKSHADAWPAHFTQTPQQMQRDFEAWVATLKATPEATVFERQSVLGDLMIAMDGWKKPIRDVASFRQTLQRNRVKMSYTMGNVKWDTDPNIGIYFSSPDGQPWTAQQLIIEPNNAAPLPDLVLKVTPTTTLRTKFYELDGKIRQEIVTQIAGK